MKNEANIILIGVATVITLGGMAYLMVREGENLKIEVETWGQTLENLQTLPEKILKKESIEEREERRRKEFHEEEVRLYKEGRLPITALIPPGEFEVPEAKIDPKTGWNIFSHPYIPFTFQYPPDMEILTAEKLIYSYKRTDFQAIYFYFENDDFYLSVRTLFLPDHGYLGGIIDTHLVDFGPFVTQYDIRIVDRKFAGGIFADEMFYAAEVSTKDSVSDEFLKAMKVPKNLIIPDRIDFSCKDVIVCNENSDKEHIAVLKMLLDSLDIAGR